MDIIDSPVQLEFKNGSIFPQNAVIIGYVFLPISVFIILGGGFIIGPIFLFTSLAVCFTRHVVEIIPEKHIIHDYYCFVGFIKIGKPYSFEAYKYITVMPLIESTRVYANSTNSTTISNNYSTVVLFKDRLKGKKHITKYGERNEAVEVAQKLSSRIGLKYFDYDPKLVRDMLLGNKII